MANTMTLSYKVTVELERESGKFVAKSDLDDEIREALISADPGQVDVDESSYAIIDWAVD